LLIFQIWLCTSALYGSEVLGDEDTKKMLREATNKVVTLHKIVLPLMK